MLFVIAPVTAMCEAARRALIDWAASGLVDDCIWVPVGGTEAGLADLGVGSGVPGIDSDRTPDEIESELDTNDVKAIDNDWRIRFWSITRSGQKPAMLSEIGTDQLGARVLAVVPAEFPEGLGSVEYGARVDEIRRTIGDTYKLGKTFPGRALFAPRYPKEPLPSILRTADWQVSFLALAEDRAEPGGPTTLPVQDPATDRTLRGSNLEVEVGMHVAHLVALLGDIWMEARGGLVTSTDPTPRESVLKDLIKVAEPGTVNAEQLQLVTPVRAFSRIIDLGYLPDHLARDVLSPTNDCWHLTSAELEPVSPTAADLNLLAEAYVVGHKEQFLPAVSEPEPQIPKEKWWAYLKRVAAALWVILKSMPSELVWDFLERWSDRAFRWLEKKFGGRIRRLREGDTIANAVDTRMKYALELARRVVPRTPPDARCWSDLRQLAFGLIDGSELPSCLSQLADPSVARAVETVLHPTAGIRVAYLDPTVIVGHPDHVLRQLDELSDANAQTQSLPSENWTSPTDETADDVASGSGEAELATTNLLYNIYRRVLFAESEAAQKLQLSLDACAEDAAAVADEGLQQQLLDTLRGKAARKKRKEMGVKNRTWAARSLFWKSILWTGFVSLVVVLGVAGLALAVMVASVAGVVVWACGLLVIGFWVAAERVKFESDRIRRAELREWRRHELAANKADCARIGDRLSTLRSWIEVVSFCCHRPWTGGTSRHLASVDNVHPKHMPTAAVAASATMAKEHSDELRVRLRRLVFTAGWLDEVYRRNKDAAEARWRIERGVDDDDLAQIPDPDASKEQLGRVLAGLHSSVGAGLMNEDGKVAEVPARVLAELTQLGLERLAPRVYPAGSSDRPPPGVVTDWIADPSASLADFAEGVRPLVLRIHAHGDSGDWMGTGILVARGGIAATNRHVVEGASELSAEFPDGTRTAIEVASTAPNTDVALVRVAGPLPPVFAEPGEASLVRTGQQIAAMGFPNDFEGAASLSWGLLTAHERTIQLRGMPELGRIRVFQGSYPSAGGASGSGVFALEGDNRGRLIGINCASSEKVAGGDPNFSFMVPIDEVVSLLEQVQPLDDVERAEGHADGPVSSSPPSAAGSPSTIPDLLDESNGQTGAEFFGALLAADLSDSFNGIHFHMDRSGYEISHRLILNNFGAPVIAGDHKSVETLDGLKGKPKHATIERVRRHAAGHGFLRPMRLSVTLVEAGRPQPLDRLGIDAEPRDEVDIVLADPAVPSGDSAPWVSQDEPDVLA